MTKRSEFVFTLAVGVLLVVAAAFALGVTVSLDDNHRLRETAIQLQQNDPIYIQPHHRELLAGPRPEEGTIEELKWEMRADAIFRRMRAEILLGELE